MIFTSFKGRKVTQGQRVRVYRNLHKERTVYSIQDPSTGLVLGYSEAVLLQDVTFKVSDAGRERVRRTGRKNVHAFVEGTPTDDLFVLSDYMQMVHVIYNPYLYKSFVREEDETMVHTATLALVNCHGVTALQPT